MIAAALIDYRQKDCGGNVKRAHIVLGLTVFAVGILSVVPVIRAAEPLQVDANGNATSDPFARDSRVSLSLPLQGSEDLTYGVVTESSTERNRRAN